ncbi:hypothetical protein SBA2_60011 [Acidobacteriia bacterium SbA2]|nr:hypothetical protein SBA2_60011 [Acidobacteriia bacterium SbA2]
MWCRPVEKYQLKGDGRAVVGDRFRPDTIWMPFHFVEESANAITNDVFDPITATAEDKCCAAALEKLRSD